MASAMLRGGKVFWWLTPPAIGLTYHLSTVKAADNPNRRVDPKDLAIYDKMDEHQPNKKTEEDRPTPLEEQVSKGRKFVWKQSESAKKATESTTSGFKKFFENTKEFTKNIQTDRTLQMKTGAITVASLAGIVLAGKGRRPLRRVFFAGGLGTATAAVCYPNKASSTIKDAYHKVSSIFQSDSSESSKTKTKPTQDRLASGETLVFEEAIYLGEMVYEDLRKLVHVEDIHVPDFMEVCKDVVQEILLGISEDFEIQTGGFIGGKHESQDESTGALLHAQEITKQAVQEILDAINEDLDIQTGGVHSEVPTIALDSTVLAKDIAKSVTKALENDLSANGINQQSYLFSDPEKLATFVSNEYVNCVETAINAQVKSGRCHVLLNSTSIAAKTGAELREAIEDLKKRRTADLVSTRPVKVSDSRIVTERVSSSLLNFIEDHVKSSRGDYGYSEAGHIVQKASKEATKAITEDLQTSGRKSKIALSMKQLAESITEEANAAVEEDIEIQTGSGFRGPPGTRKPKPPTKPAEPVKPVDANALEGIMLSPMYVPGFDHLADAVSSEIQETLHGRGVIVSEVDHLAQVITKEVLDGINEDIEIQTGGWSAPDHKPHVVLSAKDLIKMAAKEVLDAIEEDMEIQIGGGSADKKRDLFLDSTQLSAKIVNSIMKEVESDMKETGTTDTPFLFSLPEELSKMAKEKLADDIEEASMGVGRHLHKIHIDVEALASDVGRQLKNRIEESYLRAKSLGELSSDREIDIVDLNDIRKKVGSTLKENLEQNPLVTPRPGNEPLHVVDEISDLTKRVVDEMTKAIQEDIDIQTGGAVGHGKKFNVVIDARQLTKRIIEEMEEALEEDFDIQTGRGFRSDRKKEAADEKTGAAGNPGQSDAKDKDMYSTRSSKN